MIALDTSKIDFGFGLPRHSIQTPKQRDTHRDRVRAAQEVARLLRHQKRFDPARRHARKVEAARRAVVRATMESLSRRSRRLTKSGWAELLALVPQAAEAALSFRRPLRYLRRAGSAL